MTKTLTVATLLALSAASLSLYFSRTTPVAAQDFAGQPKVTCYMGNQLGINRVVQRGWTCRADSERAPVTH